MSLGFWVVLGVVLFVIGNVMALKPKIHETRLTHVRLTARKLGLIPKVLACPAWLNHPTKLITQYTLIDDAWRLPQANFVSKDGYWHNTDTHQTYPINIPLTPYLVGLSTKANSVSVFIDDEKYARHFKPNDSLANDVIVTDLQTLHQHLVDFVQS